MLSSRGNPAVFDISHDEFVRLTMRRYYGTMRMKSIKGERYEKNFDLCAVIVLDTMYFYIVRQFGQQRQRIFVYTVPPEPSARSVRATLPLDESHFHGS